MAAAQTEAEAEADNASPFEEATINVFVIDAAHKEGIKNTLNSAHLWNTHAGCECVCASIGVCE